MSPRSLTADPPAELARQVVTTTLDDQRHAGRVIEAQAVAFRLLHNPYRFELGDRVARVDGRGEPMRGASGIVVEVRAEAGCVIVARRRPFTGSDRTYDAATADDWVETPEPVDRVALLCRADHVVIADQGRLDWARTPNRRA